MLIVNGRCRLRGARRRASRLIATCGGRVQTLSAGNGWQLDCYLCPRGAAPPQVPIAGPAPSGAHLLCRNPERSPVERARDEIFARGPDRGCARAVATRTRCRRRVSCATRTPPRRTGSERHPRQAGQRRSADRPGALVVRPAGSLAADDLHFDHQHRRRAALHPARRRRCARPRRGRGQLVDGAGAAARAATWSSA